MLKTFLLGLGLIGVLAQCIEATPNAFVAPGFGYKQVPDELDVRPGLFLGVQLGQQFSESLAFQTGLDYFSTQAKSGGSQKVTSLKWSADALYFDKRGLPFNRAVRPFLSFGLEQNLSNFDDQRLSLRYGFGMDHRLSADKGFRLGMVASREVSVYVALTRYFEDWLTALAPVDVADVVEISHVDDVVYLDNRSFRFNDLEGHWVREAANKVGSLAIMKPNAAGHFLPKAHVTYREALSMVSYVGYLAQLADVPKPSVSLDLNLKTAKRMGLSLDVLDVSNSVVNRILSVDQAQSGDVDLTWSGRAANGERLLLGPYTLRLDLSDGDTRLSEDRFFEVRRIAVTDMSSGFYNSLPQSLKKSVVDLSAVYSVFNLSSVDLDKPIRRIEFVALLAKVLEALGASVPGEPLHLQYADFSDVPAAYIGDFNIYLNAFNISPNSEKAFFYPQRELSRAEAAVIIKRFLDWKEINQ